MNGKATIEHFDGGTVFAGRDAVEVYRLIALRSALGMEMRGLKLSRGISALKAAKLATGLKSNNRAVQIEAVTALLNAQGEKVQVVTGKAVRS